MSLKKPELVRAREERKTDAHLWNGGDCCNELIGQGSQLREMCHIGVFSGPSLGILLMSVMVAVSRPGCEQLQAIH